MNIKDRKVQEAPGKLSVAKPGLNSSVLLDAKNTNKKKTTENCSLRRKEAYGLDGSQATDEVDDIEQQGGRDAENSHDDAEHGLRVVAWNGPPNGYLLDDENDARGHKRKCTPDACDVRITYLDQERTYQMIEAAGIENTADHVHA